MIDLGSMTDKFSETGQKVVRCAIEVSKSRDHNFLSVVHVFTALGDVENALFAETMQAIGIDPHSVTRLLDQELARSPRYVGSKMAIPEATRELFNRALRRVRKQGRQQIESYDLFAALFTDSKGVPAELLRHLGVDPALATDTISRCVRTREEQTESLRSQMKGREKVLIHKFKFSDLTAPSLKSIVRLHEKVGVWEEWEQITTPLTETEQQQIGFLIANLRDLKLNRLNEATVWARAIYPLLVMAERPGVQAWSQVEMSAYYRHFMLEGCVDGLLGKSLLGDIEFPYLIIAEAKKGNDVKNPLYPLLGQMLAGAWINHHNDSQPRQEIFGCYIIVDTWTFFRGVVEEIESDSPMMTLESSREYAEKIEAGKILQILKSITGNYWRKMADAI